MYIDSLYDSFKKISKIIKYGNLSHINSKIDKKNSSNDSIKQMDIISENYIIDSIKDIPNIVGYISEELEDIYMFENKKNNVSDKNFILAFDPIDGTKNLLSNITIGTIYCLYEFDVHKKMILNIKEAGYCLYGPKTILVRTNGNIVEHLSLIEDNVFKKDCNLSFKNNNDNIYCINESNKFSNEINDLIAYYKSNNYNQRWVGSMVADCHQILCKGGIFMYPDSDKYPNGKLRLLYEVLPFSYIFKVAGGIGLDTNLNNILEKYNNYVIKKKNIHISIPIILCSKKEYNILTNYLEIRENIFC